jgi:hypothetical protein
LNPIRDPRPEQIPGRVNEFLQALPGPSAIHLTGEDTTRTRVLVTLSHGNEPSGLEAVHNWLLEGRRPRVNVVIILGAVEAALAEPLFFHRQLPGSRDLNRCFNPPYKDRQGQLAQSMLRTIRELEPEAVVDLHNTSGSSDAFSISIGDTPERRALASRWVNRLIITDLRLGSLMEQDFGCPVITVEAGGSQDAAADIAARRGIERYFMDDDLFKPSEDLVLLRHPLRLELAAHSRIDYADRPLHDRDIVVRDDIERFNFAPVNAGDLLGWLDSEGLDHLQIGSDYHPHAVDEFFRVDDGRLFPRQTMRLFMATTRPDIAASDCLFYFVCDEVANEDSAA